MCTSVQCTSLFLDERKIIFYITSATQSYQIFFKCSLFQISSPHCGQIQDLPKGVDHGKPGVQDYNGYLGWGPQWDPGAEPSGELGEDKAPEAFCPSIFIQRRPKSDS